MSAPHTPSTHIEVKGDKPKVERARQYFFALRAGLKTSEETSYFLQREIESLLEQRDLDREEFQLACGRIDALEVEAATYHEALERIADESYVGNYAPLEVISIYRKWAQAAIDPAETPVASQHGERSETE